MDKTNSGSPPHHVTGFNALQHVALSAVTLVFPRTVAQAAGIDAEATLHYISLAMVAMGIATLLQAWGTRMIGTGYLLLGHCTILYLPVATEAARTGGLGAVAGLTIVAGITEMILSRGTSTIRKHLPTEVVGMVVFLLGILLGLFALRLMLGAPPLHSGSPFSPVSTGIAAATMVLVATRGKPAVSTVAVLIGIVAGYCAHMALVISIGETVPLPVGTDDTAFHWPLDMPNIPPILLPGALIGALASFVRATADITACQQLADRKWKRIDFDSVQRGTFADGLGCCIAGLIGVSGTNTFSGSVGLAAATGVRARRVGIVAGATWVVLGLTPGTASFFYSIPLGVLGAALFYSSTFTIKMGLDIVAQRLVDTRRTVVIGSGIVLGLVYDTLLVGDELPALFEFARSPLALALSIVIALNLCLRIGVNKSASLDWRPADGIGMLDDFSLRQGARWGARTQLIERMRSVLEEFGDSVGALVDEGSSVAVEARYDEETGISLNMCWCGAPMEKATSADDGGNQEVSLQWALMQHRSDQLDLHTIGKNQHRLTARITER